MEQIALCQGQCTQARHIRNPDNEDVRGRNAEATVALVTIVEFLSLVIIQRTEGTWSWILATPEFWSRTCLCGGVWRCGCVVCVCVRTLRGQDCFLGFTLCGF